MGFSQINSEQKSSNLEELSEEGFQIIAGESIQEDTEEKVITDYCNVCEEDTTQVDNGVGYKCKKCSRYQD